MAPFYTSLALTLGFVIVACVMFQREYSKKDKKKH